MNQHRPVNVNFENGFGWGFRVGCGLIMASAVAFVFVVVVGMIFSTFIVGLAASIVDTIP